MKIDILGTPYELLYSSQEKDERLVQCDGYCDDIVRVIPTCSFRMMPGLDLS